MVIKTIILIGVGGIGSHTALLLGRMNCDKLTIYDHDLVETHNQNNQIYFSWDVGRPKVEALRWYFHGLPGAGEIIFKQEKVGRDTILQGIVIAAVDNLETRQAVAEAVSPGNPNGNYCPLLIVPGAAANFGLIYVFDPNDSDQISEFRKIYFGNGPENQAANPCVDPEIGPVFAGCIAKIIKRFWQGWRPIRLTRIEIDFGDLTEVRIREI